MRKIVNHDQVNNFLKYLILHGVSKKSIKFYKSDLINFLYWANDRKLDNKLIREFVDSQVKTTPPSTINRRLSTLRAYSQFLDKNFMLGVENISKTFTLKNNLNKILKSSPYRLIQETIIAKFDARPKLQGLFEKIFFNRPNWYKTYHSYPVANYIHIAILVLFCAVAGYAFYDQVINTAKSSLAYPSTPVTPNRYLSFQGRLTNNLGNPITTARDITFKLYTASSGGSTLWDSTACSITPDGDGIFSTLLGSTCGGAIASSVFSENASVWVGVTVGADAEATPRIQIATVGYALNSETLQGFPLGTGVSTVPYLNSSGELVIAASSPKIQSTSGTFAVEGVALTLTTPNTSNGIITINPDGTGTLDLTFEGAAGGGSANGFINATNANITSGALYGGTVASAATGYNFIDFKSGVSPTSKFSVNDAGNITTAGDVAIGGGNINPSAALTIGDNGDTLVLDSSDWDINATGDMTGIGNITADGTISFTGTTIGLGTSNSATTFNVGTGTGGNTFNIATNNTTKDTVNIGSALDDVIINGAGTGSLINFANFDVEADGDIVTAGDLNVNGDNITADGVLVVDGAGLTLQTTGAGTDITINAVDQIILTDFASCTSLETVGGVLTCGSDDGGATAWDDIGDPDAAADIAFAEYAETLSWNTAASSAAFNGLTVQITNDAGTDGGTQQLLVLNNVDDAGSTGTTESLLTIVNNDANEAVTDGILFGAGGAGTDFTDGIDFSAANLTREIVLENGEAIIGQTADTITFEDDDGTDYATLSASALTVTGDLTISGDDLYMTTNTANYFLMADGTNYNPTSPADARTGLGLTAGGTGDIWVEKAGDTMTGALKINANSTTAFFVEQDGVKDNTFIVDTTNGAVGIGTAPSSTYALQAYRLAGASSEVAIRGYTNVANSTYSNASALDFLAAAGNSSGALSSLIGINGTLQFNGTGTGTLTTGTSMNIGARQSSANAITTLNGASSTLTLDASKGTVSYGNNYSAGFTVGSGTTLSQWVGYNIGTLSNSGTVTNAYGLKMPDINIGGTSNYAIQTNAGNIVFNEGGDASTDLRVEGDTDANLLFVDASSDNVGIGVADPDTKLEVFHAGNQLKLSFDATDNTTFGVDTDGNLTIDGSGTKTIISDDLQITGADILDTNGNEFLRFTSNASAVNELTIANAATGGVVTLAATGGDTDIALSIDSKGADAVNIAGTSTGGVNIAGSGTGDVNIAGGSGSTGCTIDNATGNLTCSGTISGTFSIAANSLDFTEFKDGMALDADTSIAAGAGEEITYNKTFTNDTSENGFVMNFTASDTGSATTAQYGLYLDNVDSTEAVDSLISLNNADADDAVGSAILFTAGGAGTDFTYGINFDAADIGTAEIILENAETIDNQTDGTIALSGILTVNGTSGNGIDITNTGITNDIVLQNDETIDNNTDDTLTLTATYTAISGDLKLIGKDIYDSVGTTMISFAPNPANVNSYNTLAYGSWLIENPTNDGIAALMVNQQKSTVADIFTASASGSPKFTITNSGVLTLANGETIENSTDNIIKLTTATTELTGDLTISGDDLYMGTNTANYFLMADGTNYNPTSPADARTGLGLVAGGAGDIWVEKAGDTMTGALTNTLASGNSLIWDTNTLIVDASSDRVGIGTATPANQLDVTTGDTTSTAVHIGETINNGGFLLSTVDSQLVMLAGGEYTSGAWIARDTTFSGINMYGGDIFFYGNTGLSDDGALTPSVLMNIDGATGNVGVGMTAAGTQQLDVNGDLRVRGSDITDASDVTRITLGATTTLTNTTTTLSGTTTITASSLATLTTSSALALGGATTLTFTSDNATIYGSDSASGNLTLEGTSNATKTNSYVILQPTSGKVGVNTTTPSAIFEISPNTDLPSSNAFEVQAAESANLNDQDADDITFTNATTCWTYGTGWARSGGTALHTVLNTADLSCNLTAGYIDNNQIYRVTFTVGGRTAGTVTPKIGTAAHDYISANASYDITIDATANDADLIFTPDASFNGYIDNVYIYRSAVNTAISNAGRLGVGRLAPAYMLDVLAPENGVIARFLSDNTTGCSLATTGTISCTSDVRLKKNIENVSFGLDTVMNLRPVEFDWKNESTEYKNLGFIAQEVEELIPNVVSTDEETGYKSINQIGLIPILTKAIQDLAIRYETLATRFETKEIKTNLISPITNSDLVVDLQPDNDQEASKLVIKGEDDSEVASIDATGKVTANTLEVENDATVAGTLYADKIESSKLSEIEDLLKEVESNQNILAQSASWEVNTATDSGTLIADSIQTRDLFVTGQAAMTSLFVSDNLATKSINSLDSVLGIQSLAAMPVEIMAGKVKIDTLGNVYFEGNVEVAGDLTVNNLVVANSDSVIATESAQINPGEIATNSIAGKAVLAAGQTEIKINNPKLKTEGLIYVTPVSSTQNKVLYVKSKDVGTFTVGFSEAIDTDVEFNWWIIDLKSDNI